MTQEQLQAHLFLRGISLDTQIHYEVNKTPIILTYDTILHHYFKASDSTQKIFIEAFKQVKDAKIEIIQEFFEKMGELLLLSNSQKI